MPQYSPPPSSIKGTEVKSLEQERRSLMSHKVHQKSQELWIKSNLSTRASRDRYGHIGIKPRSVYNWTVFFLHWEKFFCRSTGKLV
ncbi:hypothetical protein NPIL_637091 [Nephila pilipes]|uniref:Uncharacterized protein n=1 Tax=Nephila pilipes TaxID=299642 RepID=A0A8X6IX12_NEPPI|nr:hypothetical protein NPIL_637091 [Nephila pilipes]